MKAVLEGTTYTVTATSSDVIGMMRSFPSSGLDSGLEYVFSFDARNGDLVDIVSLRDGAGEEIGSEADAPGLTALAEDAGRFGAEELGLEDVIAIRYPGGPNI